MSTDPLLNVDSGGRRAKLTAACESCRKRKARCSGSVPCTFCEKNSFRCVFNLDRQRRGPRPKNQPPRRAFRNAVLPETRNGRDLTMHHEHIDDSEIQESHRVDELDVESSGTELLWQTAVGEIMDEDGCFSEELKHLMCHLIDVFLTHALHQHIWIMNPATFRMRLINKLCSQALLYSICALSLKFSRHPSATSNNSQEYRDQFVESARCGMVFAPNSPTTVDRIQCLAVLAAYEIGEANGRQAWLDISAANSLIQVALVCKSLSVDDYEEIERVRLYLSVLERQVCIGNGLAPAISMLQTCNLLSVREGEQCSTSSHLPDILDLFISIQKFSAKPGVDETPSPWAVDSEFMNLRQALDKFLITHGNHFEVEPENLNPNGNEEDLRIQIENIHCTLAWHCSVIALNRVYLPGPVSSPQLAIGATRQAPSPPEPFLKERREACESSASIISEICRNTLDSGLFLLPMFMGYCCFHSSVVLIHRLRSAPSSDSTIVDELKINFTFLGALRKFFEPAHEWVETLFDIHQQLGSQQEFKYIPASIAFSNYFSRFRGIEEPYFVPLDPPARLQKGSRAATPVSHAAPGYYNATREGLPKTNMTTDATWLTQYKRSLQSHILDLDHDHLQTYENCDRMPVTSAAGGRPLDGVLPSSTTPRRVSPDVSSEQILPNVEPFPPPIVAEELEISSQTCQPDMPTIIPYPVEPASVENEDLTYFSEVEDPVHSVGLQLASHMSSSYQYPQETGPNFTAFLDFGDKMFPAMPCPPLLGNLDWLQETSTDET